MTRAQYGEAFRRGYQLTIHFLLSRGLPGDTAEEAAQAAWARGWERIRQLRDASRVLAWVNSIAINVSRVEIQRERRTAQLSEVRAASPQLSIAALDVNRLLGICKPGDRALLRQHYLEGVNTSEMARRYQCSPVALRVRLLRARQAVARLARGQQNQAVTYV